MTPFKLYIICSISDYNEIITYSFGTFVKMNFPVSDKGDILFSFALIFRKFSDIIIYRIFAEVSS